MIKTNTGTIIQQLNTTYNIIEQRIILKKLNPFLPYNAILIIVPKIKIVNK